MNKIVDYIWWIVTIMLLPLDGAGVMYCIATETFSYSFYFLVVIYIALCCITGIRLCIIEKRKDK